MLPVGAYAPRWFMQNMHMDPEQAVLAFQALGARIVVPLYWGTFWLSREPALEPPTYPRRLGGRRWNHADLWYIAAGESRPFSR